MRYPSNFTQTLDPAQYDKLPALAYYDGKAKDLQHLRHVVLATRDIEKVVYVGEREQVFVDLRDGERFRPWAGVHIQEADTHGNEVVGFKHEPLPPAPGERAMSTADLSSLGFTDDSLARMAKESLGEAYIPDRLGPSMKRRETFDRVMAALHG